MLEGPKPRENPINIWKIAWWYMTGRFSRYATKSPTVLAQIHPRL